ncbi:cupin domain-containing protein [Paenisporosarcina cavernae]|uniref:Cupin domain-containing protein n=2 Tax=Paenisporosarcina cavernae TaxID=2320858 RepID=A0A385YWG8_9BACL|nr:cupin domain-containing protein [Paenisporosarcina cavernae]
MPMQHQLPPTQTASSYQIPPCYCHIPEQTSYPTDYGPQPFVFNIEEAAHMNRTFRTSIWTGKHLQLTLMCVPPCEEIGKEMHSNLDQFIRIEEGQGAVFIGQNQDALTYSQAVMQGDAIIIPAGTWHNIMNTGPYPLKVSSIYAPPNHPFGTVHVTKQDGEYASEMEMQQGIPMIDGKTPDEWIMHTEFLVEEGLEDVKKGINSLHLLQEFILMGVLVGKGYSPEVAYETVEQWEKTGESKLLQQSKNM